MHDGRLHLKVVAAQVLQDDHPWGALCQQPRRGNLEGNDQLVVTLRLVGQLADAPLGDHRIPGRTVQANPPDFRQRPAAQQITADDRAVEIRKPAWQRCLDHHGILPEQPVMRVPILGGTKSPGRIERNLGTSAILTAIRIYRRQLSATGWAAGRRRCGQSPTAGAASHQSAPEYQWATHPRKPLSPVV